MEHHVTDQPVYTETDYLNRYTEKVVEVEKGSSTWWMGTGISPAVHPANHKIPMNDYACAHCGFIPPYMAVIAAQHVADQDDEEGHWVYEFKCDGCGKFNHVTHK